MTAIAQLSGHEGLNQDRGQSLYRERAEPRDSLNVGLWEKS